MQRAITLIIIGLLLLTNSAFAQDEASNTVTFNGFSFAFDSALATSVNIWNFTGDPVESQLPGAISSLFTEFQLYTDQIPPSTFESTASIRVYDPADILGYADLQALLAERPDLAAYMISADNLSDITLPFQPVLPAAQIIRARAQYVDLDGISGISYITVYGQDASPFLASDFWYTFQGISTMGHYIALIVPLNTALFPAELPADFNYETFIAGITDYFNESTAALNAASPDDFTPSLTALDELVSTFAFSS